MLNRYHQYGLTKQKICRIWGISVKSFYIKPFETSPSNRRVQLNRITPQEHETVRHYAINHTELRHREMAYRMIDENVAFLSPTSVYRILSSCNLISKNIFKKSHPIWNPHQAPQKPDELWQADLTYIRYHFRYYYLLLFLDVFSRFIVHWKLLTQMLGTTISDAFEEALKRTGQHPILQTDNDSCFISHDFHVVLAKADIEHHFIQPHCPNQNAEIERVNRTIKEGIDPVDAGSFQGLEILIQDRIHYYNYKRYHSSIGFIPPITKYRGNPEVVFNERNRKLEKSKIKRMQYNWEKLQIIKDNVKNDTITLSKSSPKILANV